MSSKKGRRIFFLKLTFFLLAAAGLTFMIFVIPPFSSWIVGLFLTTAAAAGFFAGWLFLPGFAASLLSLLIFFGLLLRLLRVLDLVIGLVLIFFVVSLGVFIKQLIRG